MFGIFAFKVGSKIYNVFVEVKPYRGEEFCIHFFNAAALKLFGFRTTIENLRELLFTWIGYSIKKLLSHYF